MISIDAVTERLETRVVELRYRVQPASEFARLQQSGAAPTAGLAAFVLPAGIQGRDAPTATGLFTQNIRRAISVVLLVQSTDAAGRRALDGLEDLVFKVIEAIAGWAPAETIGPFQLSSARIVPTSRGMIGYLIDFFIPDQLRITP